jgi:hypothetical protein
MFYFATGITPAMGMRLTGVGSAGNRLDGSKPMP